MELYTYTSIEHHLESQNAEKPTILTILLQFGLFGKVQMYVQRNISHKRRIRTVGTVLRVR